ncbi:non-hydrolyzing UDP-N-acetylglucosamine 2-epimerase [Legionella sp. CNM-1927-20]|uniref:non-hydrolyzing UDP-N-acetylglucosamine 2-epimerase n=1 Tax=Legionella sp. CNM-1927-20 TaxID=3422221 RepID=UPI00403AF748
MVRCVHIGCIIGTRPELIKMFPVIELLKSCSWAKLTVINTAQHRNLLDGILASFQITPDIDLNAMTVNQSLGTLTSRLCSKLESLVLRQKFDVLLAAGDTTTVFVSALMAFYHNIFFGHIEAGLRTYNVREPYPEEINRVLTAPMATWHFAPTHNEKDNLLRENISPAKIIVTGNPVIDTLYWTLKHTPDRGQFQHLENIIIVTAHRRENFGQHLENICAAIIALARKYNINFVFPVHPNPHVQEVITKMLANNPKIHLIPPLCYEEFVHLMQQCILIMTDSGGIQEEAPALSKPVLVLRHTTERPAIITEGVGLLVGTEKDNIVSTVARLLEDKEFYASIAKGISPYGDGHASEKIVSYLQGVLL